MGIHGLTTFLRVNKRVLSKSFTFSSSNERIIPIVIDGWSFIYKIFEDSNLPWVYGGEYAALSELIAQVVEALIAVKIKPIFVFDGSTPSLKFATVISRLNQKQVQHSLLYFRTSPTSRNTRRFLNETSILPPLTYSVCVHVLLCMRQVLASNDGEDMLEVHFADEEADPYIVELAGHQKGYVTGQDSDFVILNSEGYAGYLPLDELLWIGSDDVDEQEEVYDDGFMTVKNKRKVTPERLTGMGLIPPASDNLTLVASLYTPTSLAHFLRLPISLLPLLGALVGNDYTWQGSSSDVFGSPPSPAPLPPKSFHNLLYERRLNLSERIVRASAVLGDLSHPASGLHLARNASQNATQLIERTISTLTASSRAPAALVGPKQIASMVETIAGAILPYALPARLSADERLDKALCPLHLPAECRLVSLFCRSTTELPSQALEVGSLYLQAYRAGRFSTELADILSTGTFWPDIFLENPDLENVARSVSREARIFGYALLENGLRFLDKDGETRGEGEDVFEGRELSHGDGTLVDDAKKLEQGVRNICITDEQAMEDIISSSSVADSISRTMPSSRHEEQQQKFITEYVRKGTRIAPEQIQVHSLRQFASLLCQEHNPITLDDPLPIQLRSEESRLFTLCNFLRVSVVTLQQLKKKYWMPLLALKMVIRRMHERAVERDHSKESETWKWTRKEARALLAAMATAEYIAPIKPPDEVSERAIQLTAQILTALEAVGYLVQILLLTDTIPTCVHKFSGMRFHALLATETDADVKRNVWHIMEEDMEEFFASEQTLKRRRKTQKSSKGSTSGQAKESRPVGSKVNMQMFSVLKDASA